MPAGLAWAPLIIPGNPNASLHRRTFGKDPLGRAATLLAADGEDGRVLTERVTNGKNAF